MTAKSKPTLLAVLLSAASVVTACARSAPPADGQAPTTESSEVSAQPPPANQPAPEPAPKDEAGKTPSGAGPGGAPITAPGARPTPPKAAAKPSEQLPEKNSEKKQKGSAGDLDQGAGRGASGLPPSGPQQGEASETGLYSELIQAFDHMAQALSAPDCVSAAVFRDRVCELSERICRLADERPSAGANQHCGDGRARCGDAKRSFATSCPTP